jgi:hypothetical protein
MSKIAQKWRHTALTNVNHGAGKSQPMELSNLEFDYEYDAHKGTFTMFLRIFVGQKFKVAKILI